MKQNNLHQTVSGQGVNKRADLPASLRILSFTAIAAAVALNSPKAFGDDATYKCTAHIVQGNAWTTYTMERSAGKPINLSLHVPLVDGNRYLTVSFPNDYVSEVLIEAVKGFPAARQISYRQARLSRSLDLALNGLGSSNNDTSFECPVSLAVLPDQPNTAQPQDKNPGQAVPAQSNPQGRVPSSPTDSTADHAGQIPEPQQPKTPGSQPKTQPKRPQAKDKPAPQHTTPSAPYVLPNGARATDTIAIAPGDVPTYVLKGADDSGTARKPFETYLGPHRGARGTSGGHEVLLNMEFLGTYFNVHATANQLTQKNINEGDLRTNTVQQLQFVVKETIRVHEKSAQPRLPLMTVQDNLQAAIDVTCDTDAVLKNYLTQQNKNYKQPQK